MTNDDERILAIAEHQRRLKFGVVEKPDRDVVIADKEHGVVVRVAFRCVTQTRAEKIIECAIFEWPRADYDYHIVEHGKYGLGKIYKK